MEEGCKVQCEGVGGLVSLCNCRLTHDSEAAAEKAAEAARKKAEKEALLREEEASLPSKPKGKAPKAEKKPRGIDAALGSLDGKPSTLNASGIDDALDALDITSNTQEKVDRHPERRFKTALAAYENKRLEDMKDDKTLRRQQKINQIKKEFETHPSNPYRQVTGAYNMTREERAAIQEEEKAKKEKRLVGVN
ncbi:hypothetical protein COCCADRAFT_101246 [Bipolaris zeicola 26-R-13]|uniref:Coiled-coil domain-containing protein n=1 Tax=Cochliobolus carbonum (strain 26-R-13) TaxID=930089 RepID=W6XVJ7_COCC2|nr:uncharacterized protein COCCADRAFT_101246 [Bipolaris zeicola 26-R-13]EUC31452.1 hypothetical protein COCCADRAFT_101246 [Bipolaris zeicola 26-R-13]